jgi:uncharacterized coiled-coil DUF342 family protein
VSLQTAVDRSVRSARRRLVAQRLTNGLVLAWVASLAAGLGWFLAEPWLVEFPPAWLRWAVVGGLAGLGTVAAVTWAVLTAPTREQTALEVDTRFDLRERVTTALTLGAADADTPAGRAVLTDATAKVAGLRVADKFPVRPRWQAALVPVFAGALALAVVFYHPDTAGASSGDADAEAKKTAAAANAAAADPKKQPVTPFIKPKPPELERKDKSEELKQLEEELNKLMEKWQKEPAETPEKKREKVTELTQMEDKIKKFNQDKFEKLTQLEKQLQQLDKLNRDKEFQEGPAKELNDALSKGDLKKAEEQVDQLKKKAKENKLDKDDLAKLDRQMEKMKQETEKLAREKEKEQKLRDLIDKAKKEGRNAESLERELDKLKQEMKQSGEAMEKMAEQMQKVQDAIKKGDMNELAEELDKLGGEMKKMEGDLEDLEDAQEYLQKLKDEMKKACKACGECEGDMKDAGRKDFSGGRGVASGEREIDRTAKTGSQEERIRGLFDPRGKKSFGGTTKGQAYTKRSEVEFGKEVQQAAQEAPQAVETQRLPRDAQESVKEYFEKLGNTKK